MLLELYLGETSDFPTEIHVIFFSDATNLVEFGSVVVEQRDFSVPMHLDRSSKGKEQGRVHSAK